MSDLDNEVLEPVQDELASLKARADMLGLSYHPSIGVEKLRDKITAALTSTKEVAPQAPATEEESLSALRMRKRREASELVRIRLTCMNPAKKEWDGEIFTCGNAVVGSYTKYVPFNVDDGWHVPRIIYNMIVDRMCQVFVTTRDARGNNVRTGKLIKEFAVEVLPNLTTEELAELARRQAMAKSIA